MPEAGDLISVMKERLVASGLHVILEPGRTLVANAAMLVTKVIGCKQSHNKRFVLDF